MRQPAGVRWPAEQPTLVGDGVVLRPWRAADIDQVAAACQDPEIQRWTTVPVPYLPRDAAEFVGVLAPTAWADRTGAAFCVTDGSGERVLGSCGLVSVDNELDVAHVGYWVAAGSRGAGVARRAVAALAAWAFEMGVQRIELRIEPANRASTGVAEAVGCACEGVIEASDELRGVPIDQAIWVLERPTAGVGRT